jgi:PelA/Pel-15E family pectate lyase
MEKKKQRHAKLVFCLFIVTIGISRQNNACGKSISWGRCLSQKPSFYGGDEAVRIADNVLLFQRDTGGWPKSIDPADMPTEKQKVNISKAKSKADATLDNGATHTQIRYLARVYSATSHERFKKAFLKGLDYLFEAQYANGGWPQRYPKAGGYSRHITYNDNAMIGAMSVLRDISQKKSSFTFIDEQRRKKASKAVEKGIECILKCQIIVNGKRTAWCQQHDEKTFEPRPARIYEKVSLCGGESVGIVRFLMSIERPTPTIIEAIEGAVAWFDRAKLTGIRQVQRPDNSERGYDKVIVKDASAPPIWARFYEIGTNRPIFCGRDGKIKDTLAEIEHERRTGYGWYGYGPAKLLSKDYPAWQKKWAPQNNVLKK